MKVVMDFTVYNEDGSVFSTNHSVLPNVDRRGLHAIQRGQLDGANKLLDAADAVLEGKIAKAS